MGTMLSFKDNSLSRFLSIEEIKKNCPSAFKQTPTNPNVSDKYIMATTEDVINDLSKLGWYPVQAKQCRAKKNSSGIRSFHMVCFQNPDVYIAGKDGYKDSFVRIILTNSHDGFNSFKFMCGLYRLVCSNGLIVADNQFVNLSIRHINYTFEELRNIVNTTIENIPNVVNTMNTMKNTILDDEQKRGIASEVVKIRKDIKEDEKFDIDMETIQEILSPVRDEDEKDDLWTVFNICQEKMIKGCYYDVNSKNKLRKQRAITSIKKDIDFNQKLWNVAMKYMPATVSA